VTFYAVELENVCPAFGWQGGPSGRTRIRTLRNQHERRNIESVLPRHSFILPFQNIRSDEYLEYLKAAHLAMYAMAHSFLVKDWLDYRVQDQTIGLAPAGSAPVQLVRTYVFGPASRTRVITKPVAGAVIYQDAGSGPVPKAGTLDTLTGLFTPSTAWTEDALLSWTGEFRVPVRFNNDFLPFSIDNASGGQHVVGGSVELIEVFGE
jgi:uncharacterized protein (TIGR02217 family)